MAIKKVYAVFFSPTGTTERAVASLAVGMGVPMEKVDLTTPAARKNFKHSFGQDELLVAGLPVYGGRLPRNLDDFFTGMQGQGAPAVAAVMYGNREYDDALIELKMRLEERGFTVKAGASFIGEHTFSHNIATGRPNADDLAIAAKFGQQIMESISGSSTGPLTLKGNYPFKMPGYDPVGTGPHPSHPAIVISEECIQCGACAENCPWGAISFEDVTKIDSPRCLRCFRCIKVCPVGAKKVTDEKFLAFVPIFEQQLNAVRKEPEVYLVR